MKKSNTISMLIIAFTILISCNNKHSKKQGTTLKNNTISINISKGFQLLESNCFACHSPKTSLEDRIAPPMAAIKEYYITEGVTKEQFTKNLLNFIENPSEENSKIPSAIERFGVMPKMNFSPKQVEQIADYIYNSKLEEPDWYENHFHNEKFIHVENLKNEDISYKDLGLKYAMNTKSVLGKNLIVSIKNKGTKGAVAFCNTRAFNIVDSAGVALNAKIKRVSDFPRNSANNANSTELNYITNAKKLIKNGEKTTPLVQEIDNKMVGYYPILTNKMCMQCHGTPNTQISPSTLAKINELYPTDKAVGYGENELRGIWVIEMDKK